MTSPPIHTIVTPMDKRSVYLDPDHHPGARRGAAGNAALFPRGLRLAFQPASLRPAGARGNCYRAPATRRPDHAESPDDLIFTSGGTESSNLAIKGFAEANSKRKGNHFVVAATEHPSVLNSIEFMTKHGFEVTQVPVDMVGRIKPEDVRAAITDKTLLVCVHLVNHDIGTIQPIKEIAKVCTEKGVSLYCDALAAAGWYPIDVQDLGVHLLSFSPPTASTGRKASACCTATRRRACRASFTAVCRRTAGVQEPKMFRPSSARAWRRKSRCVRCPNASPTWRRCRSGSTTVSSPPSTFSSSTAPCPGPERICNQLNLSTEFIEGEGQLLLLDHRRHRGGERLELREQVAQGLARALGHPSRPCAGTGQHHHEPRQGQHGRGRRLRRRALRADREEAAQHVARCGRNSRKA